MKQKITVLGSTGSIGKNTLDVVARHPDRYEVFALSAATQVDLMLEQCAQFKPRFAVMASAPHAQLLAEKIKQNGLPTSVLQAQGALEIIASHEEVDAVMAAIVGAAGLSPCLAAARAGKRLLLANKEALVVGGNVFMRAVREGGATLLPIDSEHSAIFQCIVGEFHNPIEKIILTASGGPFRGKKKNELVSVTKAQALKHPNWSMGAKVTIDSATLMNKGLEVIEAKWLFGLKPGQIEVIVHPQSIIHSMVQFYDGSIKAQLGLPDMRLPIQFAMGFPERLKSDFPRFDFSKYPSLTFEQPDTETFRNLALAFEALDRGGNNPCVLNAANEIAVAEFLNQKLGFLEMTDVVAGCMDKVKFIARPSFEDYQQTDKETRIKAKEMIR